MKTENTAKFFAFLASLSRKSPGRFGEGAGEVNEGQGVRSG